jgi:DNA-binding transcriptional LysR family regulator
MELRHLRSFIAVAEELHFGHAARRIMIAQPALSKHIQSVEAELHTRLLERTSQRVSLTPAGEGFLAYARELVALADRAEIAAHRASVGELGMISIGYVAAMTYSILPPVVAGFAASHPDVEINLNILDPTAIYSALRQKDIDVGFMRAPVNAADLLTVSTLSDELLVALPAGHRLAACHELRGQDLADELFVLSLHPRMIEACAAAGFTPRFLPNVTRHGSDLNMSLSLVAAGLGISMVARSTGRAISRPGVVFRPLAQSGQALEVAVLVREGPKNPVLNAFLETTSTWFVELGPQIANRVSITDRY